MEGKRVNYVHRPTDLPTANKDGEVESKSAQMISPPTTASIGGGSNNSKEYLVFYARQQQCVQLNCNCTPFSTFKEYNNYYNC